MAGDFSLVNRAQVESRLKRLLREHGVGMQFAGRDLMRMAASNLLKYTYPKSASHGKRAIRKDVSMALGAIGPQDETAPYGEGYILVKRERGSGAVFLVPQDQLHAGGGVSDVAAAHNALRTKRGRVPRDRDAGGSGPNGLKVVRKPFFDRRAIKQHSTAAQKRVGKAKAGWAPAAEYFAGRTGGRAGVPKWAATDRHGRHGRYVDMFLPSGSGHGAALNDVPYVSHPGRGALAVATRVARKFVEKVSKKQIERIAERFNREK